MLVFVLLSRGFLRRLQCRIMITLLALLITLAVATASLKDWVDCPTLEIAIWHLIVFGVNGTPLAASRFYRTPGLDDPAFTQLLRLVVFNKEGVARVPVYSVDRQHVLFLERDTLFLQPICKLLAESQMFELSYRQYLDTPYIE